MPFSKHPYFESLLRRGVRAAGSARVAVAELLALALACAVATLSESGAGATVTGARPVWDAPWFIGGLGLLALNLLCATFTRWPWRRKHAGFVATHYGIILLLTGGLVGRKYGFETRLRLHAPEAVRETQMIFAKHDPVVVRREGPSSGVRISLDLQGIEPRVILEAPPLRRDALALSAVLGKTIPWPDDGGAMTLRFQGYWPDFAMGSGGPVSRSDAPNNPALLVQLTSPGDPKPQTAPGLGVQVRLLRFEAAADEGDESLSDFRSTVRLSDPADARPLEAVISMNHPAAYPPGFWQTALGLNTRFSQAEWNPADLRESTIQALRDPGWPFKWVGSLLFCAGLVGIFYFK